MTAPPASGPRCPSCRTAARRRRHYVCGSCWWSLPAHTRTRLNRRDSRAAARLIELHRQLAAAVPLAEIEVSP
jgi:hypothetical protein